MGQLFSRRANEWVKLSFLGLGTLVILGVASIVGFNWSPWETEEEIFITQPVPFSHEHHVSGLGIDCRYCHASVQKSSSAGMPATQTCMSCHSQVWTEAEMLEPVRKSYRTGQPIQWTRVHDLPDYVYFSHSIHVNSGVGCESCHGRVDRMPLMYQANEFYMQFCLNCHRNPANYLRPSEFIYAFGYGDDLTKAEQVEVGRQLIEEYNIRTEQLTDCSICHR